MFVQSMAPIIHKCVEESNIDSTHVFVDVDTIVFMKTYGERVKERREELGMTQTQLSKAIGGKHGSTVGNIELRDGESRYTFELSEALGVTVEWLRYGKEPKLLPGHVATFDENVSPGPDSRGQLPLISWVKAGEFCDVIDNFVPGDAEAWYPCPVSHGPNAYILRVNGESMSPEYRDGELIFIDQRCNYEHGDDVIVRSPDHKATFKRLQITHEGTFLLAINPAWPDRIIKIPENSQICGKVIFQGRPR